MGFWSRLTKTFRRQQHNAKIDEELRFHLEMKTREGQRPRDARLRFGNPMKIREETRDAGILEWLDSLVQDARYGLRQMRRACADRHDCSFAGHRHRRECRHLRYRGCRTD
jgi:hypothetical protein